MILHAEGRKLFVPQPLDGIVVQVAVRNFEALGKLSFIDRESVILGRDFDRSGFQVQDWLVSAAVAKLELKGLCSAG
jgi:hypothetical protein